MGRVILHYDMDAFFASVEIRDNKKLKNKPLVVGESIVTTASYSARKYGIHSAMSTAEAKNYQIFWYCPAIRKIYCSQPVFIPWLKR